MILADRGALVARLIAGIDRSAATAEAERPGAVGPQGYDVPAKSAERERLRKAAMQYAADIEATAPLPLRDLLEHADRAVATAGASAGYMNFMAVLLSNEIWRAEVAATPFERRLFLLPQCMRSSQHCRGEFDELGLLCARCGACPIAELEELAERLGYLTLVAEGTTIACRLIEMGMVDAIVGVSCLSVLERAFAPMSEDAIPGIAIPLIRDGCEGTEVEVEWVLEHLSESSPVKADRIDIDALRQEIASWFEPGELSGLLGSPEGSASRIAYSWLGRAGKRWRPLLTVLTGRALGASEKLSHTMRHIAVAIECFHKASLVHDDIEDADERRYEEPSLHEAHGIGVALNAGDLLIGEGYRMIAECGAPADEIARMLSIAAEGHRTLCVGQGEELSWRRSLKIPLPDEVIDIFRRKTAPAFEVALRLAAVAAGADESVHFALRAFSGALGVAYQVHDDIEDFAKDASSGRSGTPAPSLVLALACRDVDQAQRAQIARLWFEGSNAQNMRESVAETGAIAAAREIKERYRSMAVDALQSLRNSELKSLLQRCIGRILGPQHTYEYRHARSAPDL